MPSKKAAAPDFSGEEASSYGSKPTAQAVGDPFSGAPLAEVLPALQGESLPPFSSTAQFLGAPPAAPKKPATPEADPFAGAPIAQTEDAFAGAPTVKVKGAYTIDELKAAPTADLVKDKDFSPTDYIAQNEGAANDPKVFEKVLDVYKARNEQDRFGVLGDLGELINVTKPGAAIERAGKILKGGVGVAKAFYDTGKQVVSQVARSAAALGEGDIKKFAAPAAEFGQALGVGEREGVHMLLNVLRGTKELVAGPKTTEDYRNRFFSDLAQKKEQAQAAAGNSEVAQALGDDAESLKEFGIITNPEAAQKLSLLYSPVNYIPIGVGIGAVGRGGKFLIATTKSAETAQKFAAILNDATKNLAAGGVRAAGAAVEKAGEVAQKGAAAIQGSHGTAAIVGGIVGHAASGNIVGAAGKVALLVAAPKVFELAGKGLEKVGGFIKGTASAVGEIASETALGAAHGVALTLPLTIGATPEEREALEGGIAFGAALRGAGAAKRVAGGAVQEGLAKQIFKTVDRIPVEKSPAYGTDGYLDAGHEQQRAVSEKSSPAANKILDYMRDKFRDSGIEIYNVDRPTFVAHVDDVAGAAEAKGFFVKPGERVNADGSREPVVQIILNGTTDGLSHELFHAFDALDPKGAEALKKQISDSWTPDEKASFAKVYDSALNNGRPDAPGARRLTAEGTLTEAAAEVFSRVLDATSLEGIRPSVQQKAALLISSGLEKLGVPLAKRGEGTAGQAGVSELGVRGSTKEVRVAQEFALNLAKKVKDTGRIVPVEPAPTGAVEPAVGIPNPIVSGAPPKVATTPKIPAPATPAPAPAAPAAAPAAPAAAPAAPAAAPVLLTPPPTVPISIPTPEALAPTRNIRVTPGNQNDFAAKRAAVTNTDRAATAAEKLAPEVKQAVTTINQSVDAGQTVFEIEHRGVQSESTPAEPSGRAPRRQEQEDAYRKESYDSGEIPPDIRDSHQKVVNFVRWEIVKNVPQLIGYSLDKAIANIHHLVKWSNEKGVQNLVPYEAHEGVLSSEGWNEVVQDLKDYYANQSHGYRGDGHLLVRPKTDIGVSLPPQDPGYSPVILSPEKTGFLNTIQGLATPKTTREVKGAIPGNVKAQLVAELQGRTPERPSVIAPSDVGKQTFKTKVAGREFQLAETNPLRNDLAAAGVPIRELIETTERLNADDIAAVRPRPDLDVSPGVTDIIRGGFLPSDRARQTEIDRRLEEKKKYGIPTTDQERQKTAKEVDFDARNGRLNKPPTDNLFLPAAPDRISAEVAKRLEDKRQYGIPTTDIVRKKTLQEVQFDARNGRLSAAPAAGKETFFLPGFEDKSAKQIGEHILTLAGPEWKKLTDTFKGGLTGGAIEFGINLKDRADITELKTLEKKAREEGSALIKAGDFEKGLALATQAQFFREAREAATDTGSASTFLRKHRPGYNPPFSPADNASFLPGVLPEYVAPIRKKIQQKGADTLIVAGAQHNKGRKE